jgi:hypothetical protein
MNLVPSCQIATFSSQRPGFKLLNKMGKAKKGTSKKLVSQKIDPTNIRFTHSRIRPFFTGCGKRIEDTLDELLTGKIVVSDLPLITVVVGADGHMFSLNNRRLYVIKELQTRGLLPDNTVEVRIKPALGRELERYTPERCSLTASIMREHPKDDSKQNQCEEASSSTPSGGKVTSVLSSAKEAPGAFEIPSFVLKKWKVLLKQAQKHPSTAVAMLDEWASQGKIDDHQQTQIMYDLGIDTTDIPKRMRRK